MNVILFTPSWFTKYGSKIKENESNIDSNCKLYDTIGKIESVKNNLDKNIYL